MRKRDAKDKEKKSTRAKGNKDQISFDCRHQLRCGAQLTRKIVKRLANVNRENR